MPAVVPEADILAEAKRRFCLDYPALEAQSCDSCEVGRGGSDSAACPLRMREISAVQSQLNRMASDTSENHANWRAEYQNDPPEPVAKAVVRVTTAAILDARSGLIQRVASPDTEVVVQGRDVGRHWIHTVTMAIRPGRIGNVIDYYATPVESPKGRVDTETSEGQYKQQQIELAMRQALQYLANQDSRSVYRTADGRELPIALTCYDSRYGTHIVRTFVDAVGPSHVAVMGCGTARGLKSWSVPKDALRGRRRAKSPRDRVYLTLDGNCYTRFVDGNWRFYAHTDWYKQNVHSGFLLSPEDPGSLSIFDPVDDDGVILSGPLHARAHATYAQHITSEEEEQVTPGMTRWVKAKGREANHYLDSTYLCLVAVSILEHLVPNIQLSMAPAPAVASQLELGTVGDEVAEVENAIEAVASIASAKAHALDLAVAPQRPRNILRAKTLDQINPDVNVQSRRRRRRDASEQRGRKGGWI